MNSYQSKYRKPKSVADILESTFKHLHISKQLKKYESFQHWPEVVGDDLAKVAYPEKISGNKILVVRVLNSTWAQELTFKKNEILEKMNNLSNNVYLEDVRFLIGDPKLFTNK